MAKIFLVLFKNRNSERIAECRLKAARMMNLLCPDHLTPSLRENCNENTALFLFNKRSNVEFHDFSVCAGSFTQLSNDWWSKDEIPDSASLLIHTNVDKCTVIANSVGGRCTWYYQDEEQFIVSTSQRAIIAWLGSFQSNPQAISWMLATGNLGPGNSWDKRIMHLPAATTITLNRDNWKLSKSTHSFSFIDSGKSFTELKVELNEILDSVFSKIKIELPFTALTLSGGYDSRTVLYYMVKHSILVPTVTWGLSSSLSESKTDAYAAKLLANKFGVPHRFFSTDFKDISFETVFKRYIEAGEGRLDHINSFMDGLRMWKNLSESGIRHIIRADEVFGWLPAKTDQDVRISLDMHRMEDNSNMLPLSAFGLEAQQYPQEYLHQSNETLEQWKDRLYRQFRLPYVLTSLHDIVHPYVEVLNPFLHEKVVGFCNQIPDPLRTQKKLYSQTVAGLIPAVSIARKASIPEPSAIFRYARIVSLILDELASEEARTYLGSEFLSALPNHLFVDDNLINKTNSSFKLLLKSAIPWQLKKLLRRDLLGYHGDFNQLAFRAAIITRMHRLLKTDSKSFENLTEFNSTVNL